LYDVAIPPSQQPANLPEDVYDDAGGQPVTVYEDPVSDGPHKPILTRMIPLTSWIIVKPHLSHVIF